MITHSGLQLGGAPMYPGKHEHVGEPDDDGWHCEFGPQGEGAHGSFGASKGGGGVAIKIIKRYINKTLFKIEK